MTTDSSDTALYHWFWDLLKIVAFLATIVLGVKYTPEAIEGIPFVRVLPALVAAGFALLLVDIIRLLWVSYRGTNSTMEDTELAFATAAVVAVFVVVASPFVDAWMRFKRSMQ